MYVIYALIDPRDNTVHYVGQTSDVYARFQQHIRCESSSFTKNAWIMELRAANKMVIMETLEETETYQEALEREAYWIKHFEMLKEPIANISKRSSPRKAKKTNLRVGRSVLLDVASVASQMVHEDSNNVAPIHIILQNSRNIQQKQEPQKERLKPKSPSLTGEDIREGIRAWENGANSVRKLQSALHISDGRARKLRSYLVSNNLVKVETVELG